MNPTSNTGSFSLFAYPFRIFFLSTALWAVVGMVLWITQISGLAALPLHGTGLLWHRHEMLFGLVNPAIAGFLLTAVCVWTQTERLHGLPLIGLWLVWLAGRLVWFSGEALPDAFVNGLNLLFLPLVMLDAGRRIIPSRQTRQYPILGVLAGLWLGQFAVLTQPGSVASEAVMVLLLMLMLIIGGRITPSFSDNWLKQQGQEAASLTLPYLEKVLLPLMAVLVVSLILLPAATPLLAATAGVITLTRVVLWKGWRTRDEPLLWSLHLGMLWIPAALFLLAGGKAGWWNPLVWLHAAGAGAAAGLILAVMTRVSLGHTGRPLRLPSGLALAYKALFIAALFRVLAGLGVVPYLSSLTLAASLWCSAFVIFLLRYSTILCTPRADGRPG
ncbi:MAG: NnrS family protein [Hahellaceae bacterium]|nr:NnrS family protein [Hahellaceae bacterium]